LLIILVENRLGIIASFIGGFWVCWRARSWLVGARAERRDSRTIDSSA